MASPYDPPTPDSESRGGKRGEHAKKKGQGRGKHVKRGAVNVGKKKKGKKK